ncbi:MAG TPA: putative Ig domain-containing protein [Bryobacteraceae bacterium]|nr:putative Ig domain-containing protein [Bryobacteraceae bacterium]
MRTTLPVVAVFASVFLPSPNKAGDLRSACSDAPKHQTEVVTSGKHTYTVTMGGTIDGEMTRDPIGYWAYDQYWEPNLFVRIENIGDETAVNPWLLRKGRPDTRTVQGIVGHVLEPSMSEAERARRLWEFEIKNRFHATTEDHEVDDVIKRFNCYGYTLCGNESKIMSDLWRGAGLKTRRGFPNGHSTAEVYYDDAWHLLDSDESIICLLRDNKTIASEEQIVRDHDLMKRTHSYGPLHDDNPLGDETSAALHYYEGERSGEQPSFTRHTMNFSLRPGEAITWAWNPGNRFHGKEFEGKLANFWNKRWRLIANVMNGELSYTADLTRKSTLAHLASDGMELRESGPFGRALYVAGKSGSVVVPVKSAYPIIGGRLEVDFGRKDIRDEAVKTEISFDGGKTWKEVWTSAGSDYVRMYIDLDEFFPAADPARYEYLLRIAATSKLEQPAVCLKGVSLRSKLQMARLAMPGVSLGDNAFTYVDESGPGRKVRITHAWNECNSAAAPQAPAGAEYPPDGGKAEGTAITFRWQPPSGGTEPADYEFQLSEYADIRWVVSPNFHKLISRTAGRGTASFKLPYKGLLNPGETYYWRVRARGDDGVWGPWSKVFSFSADAPAVPVKVETRFDRGPRTATLNWEPGSGGTVPIRYRIYGSAERGFTANDSAYKYHAGVDGVLDSPPNLLLETKGPVKSVALPAELWRPYYRVVAVDASGHESGASDKAELTHPLIRTRALTEARAGAYYEAQVDLSASAGHLTSANLNGKPYHMKFRDGDEPSFELSGAPEGLNIDRRSGLIAGYLPAKTAGSYTLSVTVTDGRSKQEDAVTFFLRVRGEEPVRRSAR